MLEKGTIKSKLQIREQNAAYMQGVPQRLQTPNRCRFPSTQYCKLFFFPEQPALSVCLSVAGPQCGNLLSGKLDALCSRGETPSKTESLAEYIRRKLSICSPA